MKSGPTPPVGRAGLEGWQTYVFDTGPEAQRVAAALGVKLAKQMAAKTDRVVIVLTQPAQADKLLATVTQGGWRPALVVCWGLTEHRRVAFLAERIPVTDGSVVQNQADAIDAITGRWAPERFDVEWSRAVELASFEEHLELPTGGTR